MQRPILISTGNLSRDSLAGQVAVVTGAGRGIGYEAARALAWLGACVVIAEFDRDTGRAAARSITDEMGTGAATFIQTDVGDERGVNRLARLAVRTHGKVDIVLNNATIAPIGAVKDKLVRDWDLVAAFAPRWRNSARAGWNGRYSSASGSSATSRKVRGCPSSNGLRYCELVLKRIPCQRKDQFDEDDDRQDSESRAVSRNERDSLPCEDRQHERQGQDPGHACGKKR